MTFHYPKRLWALPCRYHNGHAPRPIDHTPVVLTEDIQHLEVWECNIVSDAFKVDYFTFITTYVEAPYNERIDKLCGTKYNYAAIAQFFAFASATLAVNVTALLDFVDSDILRCEEIAYCCMNKKHWEAVKSEGCETLTVILE